MSLEVDAFWNSLTERLCPPAGRYYVIHTVTSSQADRLGLTLQELTRSIVEKGIIMPVDYSVLTLEFGIDWQSSGDNVVDFVCLTNSKPTNESVGVIRDSASIGFPLRDAVYPIDAVNVPDPVRQFFSGNDDFVFVPAQDIHAVIFWKDSGLRCTTVRAVQKIASLMVNLETDHQEGIDAISNVLSQVPMTLMNGGDHSAISQGIAKNMITVINNRMAYRRALSVFNKQ